MTRLLASISALALAPCAGVPRDVSAQEADDRYADVMERSAWWREARFGMLIHFGAYAVPARGESVQSNERLSVAGHRPYVESFRPVDNDPSAWARLAKATGMQYAVMTAKHHDGFCLFDSVLTDYDVSSRFDLLWLDYSFDEYQGENWGAAELVAMVRRQQLPLR